MKTLSTEKEIIENTKIITSKDYTHVIAIAGYKAGKVILAREIAIVEDTDNGSMDFTGKEHPPLDESNWDKITLVRFKPKTAADYKINPQPYRFTKEKINIDEEAARSMLVVCRDAMGHKNYKSYVSGDTFDTFRDFMGEL